jgi:hypothetical protein
LLTRSAPLPLARDCLPQQKTAEGSALVNVARNLGGSFGVSLANTELLQRSQFHQARLAPMYQSIVEQITEFFAHTGTLANAAGRCSSHSFSAAACPARVGRSDGNTAIH